MLNLRKNSDNNGAVALMLRSEWTKESLSKNHWIDREILHSAAPLVEFDFSECTRIDSAGAVAILRLKNALLAKGCRVEWLELADDDQKLLSFYEKNFSHKSSLRQPKKHFLENFGRRTVGFFDGIGDFLTFLGESVITTFKVAIRPWNFRFTSLVKHVDVAAIRAMPIIMVLSFLIGLVVAYQSAGYLTKVGGEIFVVDISVMSVFRELSPMIAAILIAAR